MPAATYNLKIEQGADFKESLVLRDDQNALIDLTGYTAAMQIRPYKTSAEVLIDGDNTNGILVITPAQGLIEIVLTAAQTAALVYTKSVYDLEITKPSGEVIRLIEGTIDVSLEVTRGA